MGGNPGDTFHIKGLADEAHYHDKLEQKIVSVEVRLRELRAEWDEFIEAMEAQASRPAAAPSPAGPRDGGGQQNQDHGGSEAREQHEGTPGVTQEDAPSGASPTLSGGK